MAGFRLHLAILLIVVLGSARSLANAPVAARKPVPRVDQFGDPLPEGAIARLGSIRFRHSSLGVTSVTHSHDGTMIASSGLDGTVRLWNANDGRPIRVLSGEHLRLFTASFSGDDRQICACDFFGSVFVWDTKTGKRRLLISRDVEVKAVAMSVDGKNVYVALRRGGVRIVDASTGMVLHTLSVAGRRDSIYAICLSKDGRLLLGAGDNYVAIWSTATRKRVKDWGPNGMFRSAAFLKGGDAFVVGTGLQAEVRDVKTGRRLGTFRSRALTPTADRKAFFSLEDDGIYLRGTGGNRVKKALPLPQQDRVSHMSASPNGRFLALAGNVVRLIELKTGRDVVPASSFAVSNRIQYSPDSRLLCNGTSIWDATNGKLLYHSRFASPPVENRWQRYAYGYALVPRLFPIGHVFIGPGNRFVQLRVDGNRVTASDVNSKKTLWSFNPPIAERSFLMSVEPSVRSNRLLLTYGRFYTPRVVFVLDAGDGNQLVTISTRRPCRFSSNEAFLYFQDDANRSILVWNVKTNSLKRELRWPVPDEFTDSDSVRPSLTESSNGSRLALKNGSQRLCIWDASSGTVLAQYSPHGPLHSLHYSMDPAGTLIAWIDGSAVPVGLKKTPSTVRVNFLGRKRKPISFVNNDYRRGPALHVSPNSRYLCAAGDKVQLWDLKTERALWAPRDMGIRQDVKIGFSADSQYLAATTALGEVSVFDLRSSTVRVCLRCGDVLIKSVKWSPDGRAVVVLLENRTALLYRLSM